SNVGLCHAFCILQKAGAFFLDYLYEKKNNISRNALPTISFHMNLLITIKTSDVFVFLQTFRNYFSYQSSIINMRSNIAIFPVHSSIGSDVALKGLIAPLHSELAFSKAKDLINICLTSESDTILFTAEVNLCKKKIVKADFGPCIISVNDTALFPGSST
ncbi:mCG146327, isoform CRA_a, partial [Mus musculus]